MSSNLWRRLTGLMAGDPLDAGEVVAVDSDGAVVELATGGLVRVRGTATVGDYVYIRGGVIEGPASANAGIDQEV